MVATTYEHWESQPWGWGDRIYVSTNGGTNWTDLAANSRLAMSANGFPWIVNRAIHWAAALEMDPFNPNRVFVGSGNGIFATENLNNGLTTSTWKFMVKGLEEIVPLDFISVPGGPLITSVGDQGGFVHTNIQVAPFTNMSQSAGLAYAAKKPTFRARVENNGVVYYSTQSPFTWTKCPPTSDGMTNGKVAISADGSRILWKSAVGNTHKHYVTTNLGVNWIPGSGLSFDCAPIADPENSAKFFAYNRSDGYLYVSTDGGLSFTRGGSAGTSGNRTFRAAPGLEGHVWIAMGGGGIKYSTNSGAAFRSLAVSVCDAIAFGKNLPGATYPTLFIWGKPTSASAVGMYRSSDQGVTWLRVNDNSHQYGGRGNAGLIEGDKNVHGRVYMSSAGRGVIYMDSTVPVTGIAVAPTSWSGSVGATGQLVATVTPTNATYPSVTWASADSAIATVTANGWVTAKAAGVTSITATALDGGFVGTCQVTVTNLPSPNLVMTGTGSSGGLLTWPEIHRGWILQVQTNTLATGLGTNWYTIPGSELTNQVVFVPEPTLGSLFYRLVAP
jgi:hypothetical protein